MDTNPSSSSSPPSSGNTIIGVRGFLRSLATLAIFIIGFGIGLFVDSSFTQSGSGVGAEFSKMPVFSSVNVQGTVKEKGDGFLILEKGKREFKVYLEAQVNFVRLPKAVTSADSQAPTFASFSLEDIKEGTVVSGQVFFKKDPKSNNMLPFASSFVVE